MPYLSQRTKARMQHAEESKVGEMLWRVFEDQYSEHNPTGAINLGIAENSLMHPEIIDFAAKNLELTSTCLTYGDSMLGSKRLFKALGGLYESRFKPLLPVEAAHICTSSGVTALLDQLAHHLCDEDDAIAIPTPFYSAFPHDFVTRSGVATAAIKIASEQVGTLAEVRDVDDFLQARKEKGEAPVRAVIVTNPHNPLGFCYAREVLVEYARMAEKHEICLIVDEIYALSVYESDATDPNPFLSILSLDVKELAGCDPSRILQLYGASKDFAANGLRIGVLVAQHQPELLKAMGATALFAKVSAAADALWSALLIGPLDGFVQTNQGRLAVSYKTATTWLREHDVPYRPAYAGHFIWIDLRRFVSSEAEEYAFLRRCVEAGVFLSPGTVYKSGSPGFFRLTHCVQPALLDLGLERLGKVLGS